MNGKEQARILVAEVPRRTMLDWDNYLVEKIAELRQLVDEFSMNLGERLIK